jgi:hypothetical protein
MGDGAASHQLRAGIRLCISVVLCLPKYCPCAAAANVYLLCCQLKSPACSACCQWQRLRSATVRAASPRAAPDPATPLRSSNCHAILLCPARSARPPACCCRPAVRLCFQLYKVTNFLLQYEIATVLVDPWSSQRNGAASCRHTVVQPSEPLAVPVTGLVRYQSGRYRVPALDPGNRSEGVFAPDIRETVLDG